MKSDKSFPRRVRRPPIRADRPSTGSGQAG